MNSSGDTGVWIGIVGIMLCGILGAIWFELRTMNSLFRSRTHWLRTRMQWVIGCVEVMAHAAQPRVQLPEPPEGDWPED